MIRFQLSAALTRKVTQQVTASVKLSEGQTDKALKAARKMVAKDAMLHYSGTIRAIENILMNPGWRFFDVGGVMTKKLSVNGSSVALTSPIPWAPLNEKYIKRKPISKSYWRKTGQLWAAYRIRANAMDLDNITRYYRGGVERLPDARYLGKGRFILTFPAFPGSPGCDRLIRESFVTRQALTVDTSGLSDKPAINHMLLAEAVRPWVAAFAQQMGSRFTLRLYEPRKP